MPPRARLARAPAPVPVRATGPRTASRSRPSPAPSSVDAPPHIVYEDARHLVLNKASGVALQGQHSSPPRYRWDSLLKAIQARPESPHVYTVHRLDKSTTGCLILAKSRPVAARLSTQLAQHDLHRAYLAVVHGRLREGFHGRVDAPLRLDHDRVRLCAPDDDDAVPAATRWQCLSATRLFSLIRLEPETGRKHQLRVHCADFLKAPIVGDFKLAPRAAHAPALVELGLPLDNVLLHSHQLSFFAWDKDTGKRSRITTTCPPPPAFVRFCRAHQLALPEPNP